MFSGKGETPDKALGRVSKTHYGEQKMGLNTCMAWKLERLLLEEGFGSTGPTKMLVEALCVSSQSFTLG